MNILLSGSTSHGWDILGMSRRHARESLHARKPEGHGLAIDPKGDRENIPPAENSSNRNVLLARCDSDSDSDEEGEDLT